MSVAEMKKIIIEKVEGLSEEQLVQVAQFVDSINKIPANEYDLLPHVENIVTEREEVMNKLANNYDAIKEQYGDVLQKLAQ